MQKLTSGRNSSLRLVTESDAEQKSFYRLFNNESFSEDAIEQSTQVSKDRRLPDRKFTIGTMLGYPKANPVGYDGHFTNITNDVGL